MKQSDHFRENAENCQRLAERATDHPTYLRYKRMEDAWLSLADEQDWLDGGNATGSDRGDLNGWRRLLLRRAIIETREAIHLVGIDLLGCPPQAAIFA